MTVILREEDAAAAFAVAAVLAGHLMAEAVPEALFVAVRERFARNGLASPAVDQRSLGEVCDRLSGRIRVAVEERT